ncbi:MAG TPA: 3-phosphoshikimate 1-carboxyvinyltransferase, partial [Myxococcota bacterium]
MIGSDASLLQLRAPRALDAEVRPPGSKSLTNRALLLAALARGRTRLSGLLIADDT